LKIREFLTKKVVYKREEMDRWLSGKSFLNAKYDPDLGYLQISRRCNHGVDGSIATYTHDPTTWSRRLVNYPDSPCRINSYGDSYTYGTQVNDGETWQEVLAARLGEPIRNFGVGGYSVYQTYLRMKREEANVPARNLIINIYDDDHVRNLICVRRFKFGAGGKYPAPPQPYVEANPATKEFREHNPSTPETLYDLCDPERTYEMLKDNLYLRIVLARYNVKDGSPADSYGDMEGLAEEFGLTASVKTPEDLLATANELFSKSAVYASKKIVEKIEALASADGKKILYIGSYSPGTLGEGIRPDFRLEVPPDETPGYCFDSDFRRFMGDRGDRYVDLLDAHRIDFQKRNVSVTEYLRGYYVFPEVYDSHYAPLGNNFTANAAKEKLVEMLDPKPLAYASASPSQRDVCVALEQER
jgi:hypothetical protein